MSDKHMPKRLYVGTMNDAFFIIDKKPHPAPMDQLLPGGDTNVIAKMANSNREAEAWAALIVRAVNRDHLFGGLVEVLKGVEAMEGLLGELRSKITPVPIHGTPAAFEICMGHIAIVKAVLAKVKDKRSSVSSFRDGLRRAEEIAVAVTDKFWNTEFARHGNAGLAAMKQKVGHQIEQAIHEEWLKESNRG